MIEVRGDGQPESRSGRLDRDRAALVVIDLQESLSPVIEGFDDVVSAASVAVQGAQLLGLPVVVTEQYPQGLGPTVAPLAAHLDNCVRLTKTVFAAPRAEGFDLGGRDQVLLCGIEAHVCVYQTAAALRGQGVEVQVLEDAVGARSPLNRAVGLRRMYELGVAPSSTEMFLLELLGKAGTPEFREVQRLIT